MEDVKNRKGGKKQVRPKLDNVITQFKMAAAVALASRYETPNECGRMSVTGAKVLQAHGIEATPIPCELWGFGPGGGFSSGVSEARVRQQYADIGATPPSVVKVADMGGTPFHMVIRAKWEGKSAIIDTTLPQLWPIIGRVVPAVMVVHCNDWPTVELGDLSIKWSGHPMMSASRMTRILSDGFNDGLAEDMTILMALAGIAGNDPEKFYDVIRNSSPALQRVVIGRWDQWANQLVRS